MNTIEIATPMQLMPRGSGSATLNKYGLSKISSELATVRQTIPNAVSRDMILDAVDVLEKTSGMNWHFGNASGIVSYFEDRGSESRYNGDVHPGVERRLEEIEELVGDRFLAKNLFILAPKKMWKKPRTLDPVVFLDLTSSLFWPIFAWDGPREIELDWKPRFTNRQIKMLKPGFFSSHRDLIEICSER